MSTQDIDNPAEQAVKGIAAGVIPTQPERVKLVIDQLLELRNQIDKDRETVEDGVISEAEVIKAVVLRVAPRLAELDPDLFPKVDVVRMNGDKSTMRLLEVPGSGKAVGRPYEIYSFEIRAFVTHITQEGDLIGLAATRRQNGKRTVFIANAIHDSSPEEIVDFRDGILAALDNAAYKGVCTPKNSRLVAV